MFLRGIKDGIKEGERVGGCTRVYVGKLDNEILEECGIRRIYKGYIKT